MIDRVSKLTKIDSLNTNSPIRYNTNLPISLEVIEKLYGARYKLLLGKREFIAKSKKELKPKEKYWGDLNNTKEGIISLSNLVKKPSIFDYEIEFLSEIDEIFLLLRSGSFKTKEFLDKILSRLSSKNIKKSEFLSLTHSILAYKEGIIHLPINLEGKKIVLQFKKDIDKNETTFYMAFENLGPINGIVTSNLLVINTIFRKSFNMVKKAHEQDVVNIVNDIKPIFDPKNMLINLKG